MNDTLINAASISLVSAGLAAELLVARMLLRERPTSRRRRARPRAKRHSHASPARDRASSSWRTALIWSGCVLTGPLPAWALGAEPPPAPSPSSAPFNEPSAVPSPPALQEPSLTISTDRPSFSDGTGFVPVGHFQLETGYTYTFRDRDGVETHRHNGPEVLARIGVINDRLELRLIASGFSWIHTDDHGEVSTAQGWNDLALGLKLKLTDQDRWLPRVVLGAQTTLSIGTGAISNQLPEPTLKLIWSYDLGQSLGDSWNSLTLGGNLNLAWPTTSGDRFTQGQASLYLAFPLLPRTTGFAEYYVIGPNSKGADAAHYTDLGATYLLTDRIQLDARVGVGLNHEADNCFAGVGISFLF